MSFGASLGYQSGKRTPKYSPDRYNNDPGVVARTFQGDKRYFDALSKYTDRDPGFAKEDLEAMYNMPAEQTKLEEAGNLRRLNQGAAGSGGYGAGSRVAGRGQIISQGMRTRADLRRQVQTDQARAALEDRIRQIQMWQDYVNPRFDRNLQETGMRNDYAIRKAGQEHGTWTGSVSYGYGK